MTYPCSNCNRDEGSPICLGDERCQRTPAALGANLAAPLTTEEGAAIVRRFERVVAEYNRLFAEYQGKAMPDSVYQQFAVLRDDRLPAMRRELAELLTGKSLA